MKLGAGAEFDAIRAFAEAAGAGGGSAGSAAGEVIAGPGDDAALLRAHGLLAISSDASVEGVHFRRDWISLEDAGHRAVAAALSDLAAMAADPIGVLVTVLLPPADGPALPELARGVGSACRAAGAALLGGDLTRTTGPLALDVTVVGSTAAPVTRSGARPGEGLWVTGRLGGAGGAVRIWTEGGKPPEALRARYARPAPRIREALWLARSGVPTALLDLSDGLAGDAGHLAAASGVAVVLEGGALPFEPALLLAGLSEALAIQLALSGGEDFELAFTAPDSRMAEVEAEFRDAFSLDLTRVGSVQEGEGVRWRPPGAREAEAIRFRGFDHLAGEGGEAG